MIWVLQVTSSAVPFLPATLPQWKAGKEGFIQQVSVTKVLSRDLKSSHTSGSEDCCLLGYDALLMFTYVSVERIALSWRSGNSLLPQVGEHPSCHTISHPRRHYSFMVVLVFSWTVSIILLMDVFKQRFFVIFVIIEVLPGIVCMHSLVASSTFPW